MKKPPVQLSVHRNTVEARRKRVLAGEVTKRVEKIVRECDVRAYAFVGIGTDGKAYALWDTGAIMPQWAFADTIAGVLRTDIVQSEIEDDWRPNLTLKGSL